MTVIAMMITTTSPNYTPRLVYPIKTLLSIVAESPIFCCFWEELPLLTGANPITGDRRHALRGRCWSSSQQFFWKKVQMKPMAPVSGEIGCLVNGWSTVFLWFPSWLWETSIFFSNVRCSIEITSYLIIIWFTIRHSPWRIRTVEW